MELPPVVMRGMKPGASRAGSGKWHFTLHDDAALLLSVEGVEWRFPVLPEPSEILAAIEGPRRFILASATAPLTAYLGEIVGDDANPTFEPVQGGIAPELEAIMMNAGIQWWPSWAKAAGAAPPAEPIVVRGRRLA